jgi:peptidoglycan hydrolase-like protein with peptidoglycan-binding domain
MKKSIAVIALIAAPALASAQAGLSKIQFLALQQELRDQGCGVTNVDGHYGPQTRRAIATCAKKFNSANNAAALLTAMNIGFGPTDNAPTRGTADNSMSAGGTATAAKAEGESTKTEAKEVKKAAHHVAKKKTAAK